MADATGHSIVSQPPLGQRLTGRARAYLMIAAVRHGLASLSLLIVPGSFTSPSFNGIKQVLPIGSGHSLLAWGIIFGFTSVVCGYAALVAREDPARWALFGSIMSSLVWLGGFVAAWYDGAALSPMGVIFCAALVAKDITMIRDPLRNPFEPLLERVRVAAKGR